MTIPKDDINKQNPQKLPQLKKPATFLRRRQGMAAWCSKIKRQGMPVKDPSEDLRKQQVLEQSNVPVRSAAIEINQADKITCNISTDILQPSRSQSVCDNRKLAIKAITGGFLCGLMHRRRSTSPSRVSESGTNPSMSVASKQSAGSSQPPTMVSSLTENSVRKHHTGIPCTHSSDGSVRDAMDLHEFELLEEIVENHSLSSLSSLLASRISDKMRRIEEHVHQPNQLDNSSINATNGESSQAPGFTQLNSAQIPETSILSAVEKHCTQALLDETTNPFESNKHLLEMVMREPRKVTRFHLDNEDLDNLDFRYPSRRSSQTLQSPDKDPLATLDVLQQAEGNRVSKVGIDEFTDKEDNFDDTLSWTGGSETDLRKQMPGNKQSSLTRIYTSESQHSCEHLPVKAGTSVDREPEWMGNPVANTSDHSASPTRSYLPNSTGAPCTVGSGSLQGTVPDDRMTCLADELVEQLKREVPGLASRRQSNPTTTATALRQWISRLESEVKRFRQENASLTRLKADHGENLRKLNLDTKRFEESKLKELKVFNEYKEAELRKIKKERRVLDEYQRALKSMPSKKDREEIDRLKEEIRQSHAEVNHREARWHAAVGRLRTRLEEVETERAELRDRVRRMEEERIALQAALADRCLTSIEGKSRAGSSLRQTLNSLTQSVSLKPNFASISSDPANMETNRRVLLQQHQQHLSSCRLSARTTAISRMRATSTTNATSTGARKSLSEQQRWSSQRLTLQRRSSSSNRGGGIGHQAVPHGGGDHTGAQGRARASRSPPRSGPPIASLPSARESVVSGSTGYHTGADDDDDDGDGDSERSLMELLSTVATAPIAHVSSPHTAAIVMKKSMSQQLNQGDEVSDRECDNRLQAGNPHSFLSARTLVGKMVSSESSERMPEKLPVPGTAASGAVVRMVKHANGSTEHTYRNGAVVICYANGSVKEIFPDTVTTVVSLFNGDIKRKLPDGRVIYHYATDGTVQTTYPDRSETIEYVDGRQEIINSTENHGLLGEKEQTASDGHPVDTERTQGEEENQQCVRHLPNGDKEIHLSNGQREIHSVTGIKCRIYPDGTTKTVFPDGRHETRYASGRLRIRDVHGNLMLDTRLPVPHRLIPTPSSGALSGMPSPPER